VTLTLRGGEISASDIANAALAGGVSMMMRKNLLGFKKLLGNQMANL
jgi:hypothetical protein